MTKPAYVLPSMADIASLPWNGFNVVSTFSGAGGSCLGYRMAGFHVLWANEFIVGAQTTYRANHPTSILDTRDIRTITPEEILQRIGMNVGDVDLLDGSPPCASFSTSGSREAGWGRVKKYSDRAQRTDDLFFEYARILKGLQPKTFVAENVSGLVKGTAKGYFVEILEALKACGYRVKAKLLDAQWLGVPQARQRIIFVGVRDDLALDPVHPEPLKYRYSVREAIPWILKFKAGGRPNLWKPSSVPVCSIMASGAGLSETAYLSGGTYVEAETDISRFAIAKEYDKIGVGEASKKYFSLKKAHLDEPCQTITGTAGVGAAGVCHPIERRKFSIAELRRICAFPADFILTGTYEEQWERLGRSVPPVMMCAIASTIRDRVLATLSARATSA